MHHKLIRQSDRDRENKSLANQLPKIYEFQERREEKYSDWVKATRFKKDDA